jgi:hypothetical protein
LKPETETTMLSAVAHLLYARPGQTGEFGINCNQETSWYVIFKM